MRHEQVGRAEGNNREGQAMGGPEPWRREGRAQGGGPLKVVMISKANGPAPDPELLAGAGIALHAHMADLLTLADNAPLLAEADAMIVEIDPGSAADMEAFDRIVHLAAGDFPVIAAVEGLSVADTRTLLRAGAVDVLPLPFTVEELRQAVEPARRPVRTAPRTAAPARRQGKVIAFLGALGGVGTTTIASQLGIVWSSEARVGLVDLDIQFGSAALFLDLRPSLNIGHLIEDAERLDAELLQSVALSHSSGLSVIPAPTDMMPIEAVTVAFVDQILRTAAQTYDIVLVDLPGVWTEWTVRVLQRADIVCMVTNMTVPGVYQARRQLEVIDANGLMAKLSIIANRVQHRMFGRVDLKETEAVLGRRIDHTIANDYPTVSAANDEGRSLKEIRGSSRVLKDLKQLSQALAVKLAEGAAL